MADSDQAPPNYNPNNSMLSGGIDMPIMKVMGGGGGIGGGEGTAPNGYNETQSLLSGGIDVPIVKVEGGAMLDENNNSSMAGLTSGLDKLRSKEALSNEQSNYVYNILLKENPIENNKLLKVSKYDFEYVLKDFFDKYPEYNPEITDEFSDASKNAILSFIKDWLNKSTTRNINKYKQPYTQVSSKSTPENPFNSLVLQNSKESSDRFRAFIEDTPQENIRIVKNYKKADINEYNNFVASLQTGSTLDSVIAKLEKETVQPKKLHYIRSGNKIEISSVNSKNTSNYESIKFVPLNTKQIIVLPPLTNPEDFFNMILFLKQNGYLTISNNEFIIKRKSFVVHCSIDLNNKINKYFYLKLKKSNDNYEIMNSPYKIVYPKETDGSKGLLFSSIQLLKPSALNDLPPTQFDAITEYNIKNMYYTKSEQSYENEFSQIQGGDNDTENPMGYSITLRNNIVILDLVDEDVATINVDINGNLYRVRVPLLKSTTNNVYASWLKEKYTSDEMRLIEDLYLNEIPELNTPDKKAEILFQLTYFKCFNDTSLLTKSECFLMRDYLETIYKHVLTKD